MKKWVITMPDDWHIHLRDGAYLNTTVADCAKRFQRAIVMPNLKPPITEVSHALEYKKRILRARPSASTFEPLMTLYMTDETTPKTIQQVKDSDFIYALKLYPAGSTTHSDAGVTNLAHIYPSLEMMQELDIPLLIHGEVTDPDVDIFDRERKFIETHLVSLMKKFPRLRIVLEHITTKEAVQFIQSAPKHIAATITVHHLLLNRNALLVSGIHPHYYCLPILKRQQDQEALIQAATSGNAKFFFGSDSAPHAKDQKENACGCAGIYTAHAAIELLAEVFETHHALDNLEAFSSFNGATFYGLPFNHTKLTLTKETWTVPTRIAYGTTELIPFGAGSEMTWKIASHDE